MARPVLTFDDGPSDSTTEVLELLRSYRIRAVFFVIGHRALERPEVIRQAARDGHTIGNHTWAHPRLTDLPDAQVRAQLASASDAIEAILGSRPAVFRAPYLALDERVLGIAAELGLSHVDVDLDTRDWMPEREAIEIAESIAGAGEGVIVLLHDGDGDIPDGPNPRPTTVEALRLALPELAA